MPHLRQERRQWSLKDVRLLAYLAPFPIYATLSLSYFGTWGSWTKQYLGEGNDPLIFMWFIHWWPFAIVHHVDPFVSHYVWNPEGNNLSWTTSVPMIAFLAIPVAAFGGSVLAFNVMSMLAPALSAWTAFFLAFYLSRKWWPSLIAGYIFGFSSYELSQLLGHLCLDVTFLVPIAILLCIARVRGDISRRTFIPALAIVLMGQFGISTEILATLCLFGAMAWWIFLRATPHVDRAPLWRLAKDIAMTAPIVLVLTAPFLFYMVKGMVHGQPFRTSPTDYSADPLNFFIPTDVTLLGKDVFSKLASGFTGNHSEQGAYLGLPLIVLMICYFREHRSQSNVRAFLYTICALIVLSLGPKLHIDTLTTAIRLPWHLFMKLPLIGEALPIRFTMYLALCASIVMALWLSEAKKRGQAFVRLSVAALAVVFLLPNRTVLHWSPWPGQPFFQATHVQQALGNGRNVLILPFADTGPGMAWQLDADMVFTQAGGYLGPPPPGEAADKAFDELRLGKISSGFKDDLEKFCASHNVDHILVGPGTPPSLSTAIFSLPWSRHDDQGVVVVDVPPS